MDKSNKNSNLRKAKTSKNDEFYTQLNDIENEIKYYKEHFKNKIVFCNCDDPVESNFFLYFVKNFNHLGIKKLITTHFQKDGNNSYKIEIIKQPNISNSGQIDFENIKKIELLGNGDFRSKESIELLKECDIVVTNPPFSLFREYIDQLITFNKQFLIIGSMNAITYKEIFKLIKSNKLWLGNCSPKNFREPNGNIKKFGNILWYTNLLHQKRNEELILYKKYNELEYPKYDNYNAINVDKVKDIPKNYNGHIGVPITFLDKYNPEQFEIIGQGQGNLYRELTEKGLKADFIDKYYKNGGTGSIKENHPVLGYYNNEGKTIIPYMRIIIKNKKL